MTDIYFAAIEMDGCDEPIFVAANIENNPVIQFIGGREDLLQLGETCELSLLHDLKPTSQRHLAVGMFVPKPDQRFTGDDVHATSISQIEILRKSKDNTIMIRARDMIKKERKPYVRK